MRDVLKTTETWTYDCRSCRRLVSLDYEVWHTSDAAGSEVVTWRRGGFPSLAPWATPTCPRCGGSRVKIRPPHTSPHEARL